MDHWKSFIDLFDGEMRTLFGQGSPEYRKLSRSWLDLSEAMTRNMAEGFSTNGSGAGAPAQRIYEMWAEGSKTMRRNFEGMLDSKNPDHVKLFDWWDTEYQKVGESLTKQMLAGMKEQYELYDLWMDSFSKNRPEGDELGQVGDIMGRHYRDFMGQVGRLASELRDTTRSGEPLEPSFAQLPPARFMSQMQEAWLNTTSSMLKEVLATPAYGNYLKQSIDAQLKSREYMDNIMEDELKRLGLPTRAQLDDVYKGLNELDRKMNAIQELLEEAGYGAGPILPASPPKKKGAAGARPRQGKNPAKKKTPAKKSPAKKKAPAKKSPAKKKPAKSKTGKTTKAKAGKKAGGGKK